MSDGRTACVAIQSAATRTDVIAAVRNYLSSLDATKTALLPPTLLTVGIDHAKELAQAAIDLARHELADAADEPTSSFLQEAATVFSTASMRLAVLSAGAE